MEVLWTDIEMMTMLKMFRKIICQVFLAGLPSDIEKSLFNLVSNPEESHFHCSCTLFLDSVICNACRSGVVTMDRGWWLWVAEFFKDDA